MFLAIEGLDGAGKATQSRQLRDRLIAAGHRVELFDFPAYTQTFFGREIGRYLNGELGPLRAVPPRLIATLYAGDRFEFRERLLRATEQTDFLLCDRYVASNQAYNGAKLPQAEWPDFFAWVDTLEFEIFRIPRPDATLYLDATASAAAGMVLRKAPRSYTDRPADLHEDDADYQHHVSMAYASLARDASWIRIDCVREGAFRSVDEIGDDIWERLIERSLIPPR